MSQTLSQKSSSSQSSSHYLLVRDASRHSEHVRLLLSARVVASQDVARRSGRKTIESVLPRGIVGILRKEIGRRSGERERPKSIPLHQLIYIHSSLDYEWKCLKDKNKRKGFREMVAREHARTDVEDAIT